MPDLLHPPLEYPLPPPDQLPEVQTCTVCEHAPRVHGKDFSYTPLVVIGNYWQGMLTSSP